MCAYGLLASLLELGQVCGRHTKTSAHTEGTGAPPGHLLALAICFLAMTLSSRYSTLCVIYFVVGYCCAVINNNQKLDASALEVFYRSDVTVSGRANTKATTCRSTANLMLLSLHQATIAAPGSTALPAGRTKLSKKKSGSALRYLS